MKKFPDSQRNIVSAALDLSRSLRDEAQAGSELLTFEQSVGIAEVLLDLQLDCSVFAAGLLHDLYNNKEAV